MLRSALLAATVLTLASPSLAHDWFSELRSPTGYKCCGQKDCRPVESRYNAQSGQLELRLDRMWVPIEYNKVVREQFSPDGKYYACWRDPNFPYCFILPRSLGGSNWMQASLRQEGQDNVRWLPA